MPLNRIQVWRWPVRLMHWSMVATFAYAMWTAGSLFEIMHHVYVGYAMGVLLAARIVYGFTARDLAAFRRFPPSLTRGIRYAYALLRGRARNHLGHNPAGALAIYAMLTIGVLTVASGYWAFEHDADFAKEWHHHLGYLWLGLIGLHLFGVIMGSLAHKEFLVMAMITGYKSRRCIREPFSLQAVGITLLIMVLYVLDLLVKLFGGKGIILRK